MFTLTFLFFPLCVSILSSNELLSMAVTWQVKLGKKTDQKEEPRKNPGQKKLDPVLWLSRRQA